MNVASSPLSWDWLEVGRRALLLSLLSYLALLVCLWIVIRAGDLWWPATLALYAPRWIYLLPLAVLTPLTLALRPRWLLWSLAQASVALFTVLGVTIPHDQLPVHRGSPETSSVLLGPPTLRVLTMNVGGGPISYVALRDLIRAHEAELVCLQECPAADSEALFRELGWNVRRQGLLSIGSTHPLGEVQSLGHHEPWTHNLLALGCVAHHPQGPLYVVNVHLPTPRPGLEAIRAQGWAGRFALQQDMEYRRQAARELRDRLNSMSQPLLLAGDFNMPMDSHIYRTTWNDFHNAFARGGWGLGYTKYTAWHGARIDHVLYEPAWRVRQAQVGPDLGGDHRALAITFETGG